MKNMKVDVKKQTASDYISLRDLHNHLTTTEYYINLSPSVKRTLSQQYFRNLFVSNKLYNMYYDYKVNIRVTGNKCKKTDVLKEWQLIVDEDEKLKRNETQVNEVFNNVNYNINTNSNNTSSNRTSV